MDTYADRSRGVERRGYLRVHINAELLVLDKLGIALVDARLNPVNKWSADDRGNDIANPFPRHLPELLTVRQILEDFGVRLELSEYLLECQVIVHGHMNVGDTAHLHI